MSWVVGGRRCSTEVDEADEHKRGRKESVMTTGKALEDQGDWNVSNVGGFGSSCIIAQHRLMLKNQGETCRWRLKRACRLFENNRLLFVGRCH